MVTLRTKVDKEITVWWLGKYFYGQEGMESFEKMRLKLIEAGFKNLGRTIDLKDLGKVIALFV